MQTEYLREFVKLVECASFTKAAKELNMTQSTLSKHIIYLEHRFNTTLLERRRSVKPTDTGRLLFDRSQEILRIYDQAKADIDDLRNQWTLTIGGHLKNNNLRSLVTAMIVSLRQQGFSAVSLNPRFFESPFELLQTGQANVVFAYLPPTDPVPEGFSARKLFDVTFVGIVDSNNPLSSKSILTIDDLRESTLIKLTDRYCTWGWHAIEVFCHNHGFEPIARSFLTNTELEYLSADLTDSMLLYQQADLDDRLALKMGEYACIPIEDGDAVCAAYVISCEKDAIEIEPMMQTLADVVAIYKNERL